MGLMNFMRSSYWGFILLVILLSCQNKQTVKVQAILQDTIPIRNITKPTEYLYNIKESGILLEFPSGQRGGT